MAASSSTLTRLTEVVRSESFGKIDSEVGVIRGVRVLGRESSNGRVYSDNAMMQAASLYEGLEVNLDHSRSERKFSERFGQLESVSFRDGEVRGDLHYLKSHPYAATFVEAAQRFPKSFGLSHDAEGSVAEKNGKQVVESIESVYSVDIVGRPATNRGLFESEQNMKKMTIREIIEANAKHECACLLRDNIREMDGMADTSVEVEDGADSDAQIKAAFSSAAASVFDDTSLSSADALAKIRKLLKARDTVTGKGDSGGGSDTPSDKGEGGEMSESEKKINERFAAVEAENKKLREERDRERAENKARQLLESANVEATESRINAVVRCSDDEERKALIEDLPKRTRTASGVRPEFSPPKHDLSESAGDGDSDESYAKLKESRGGAVFTQKK